MSVRVLIVDDREDYRRSATALLEAEGFVVVGEAAEGTAAIEAAERLRPEIVLLDIQLTECVWPSGSRRRRIRRMSCCSRAVRRRRAGRAWMLRRRAAFLRSATYQARRIAALEPRIEADDDEVEADGLNVGQRHQCDTRAAPDKWAMATASERAALEVVEKVLTANRRCAVLSREMLAV